MALDAITLDQLRVFATVAQEGGFSAAARKLGRAQSAMSQAVSQLEHQLGVQLFSRENRRPVLTEEGRALLGQALAALGNVEELKSRARSLTGGLEPELSLVADVMFPLDRLAAALANFRAAFPTVPLRLSVEALGAVAKLVLDGSFRLGIMGSLPHLPRGLERVRIGEVLLIPVAAPGHPFAAQGQRVATRMLSREVQLVLTDRSELTREREFSVLSADTWRLADLGAKRSLLKRGLGWGFMPQPLVAQDLERGELVRLALEYELPKGGNLPLYAVHKQKAPPGPAGNWLIDQLKDTASDHAGGHHPLLAAHRES